MNNYNNNVALWLEQTEKVFDFHTLKKNPKVQTVMNIPVKVDKVLFDLTGETCVGVSGTFVMKGIRVRGIWDTCGNILHFKKTGILFNWKDTFDKIFCECNESMFQLVTFKEIENE